MLKRTPHTMPAAIIANQLHLVRALYLAGEVRSLAVHTFCGLGGVLVADVLYALVPDDERPVCPACIANVGPEIRP